MSRTIRKKFYDWFRHPKGFKRAKINGARPGAVPRTEYDDINISDEALKQERRDNEPKTK